MNEHEQAVNRQIEQTLRAYLDDLLLTVLKAVAAHYGYSLQRERIKIPAGGNAVIEFNFSDPSFGEP